MIRAARAEDAPAICAIWNDVIRTSTITYTTEEKTGQGVVSLIAAQPVFVAAQDSVVGFATYGPFRSGPGYRYVAEHSIYLAAAAQGRGLGRALLAAIEGSARETGIDVLIGGMDGNNKAAQQFHARLGFVEVGRFPGIGAKFAARHDLVLMQKNLTPRH